MALPNPENLAYRGITSGNAECMAYRGFICGQIVNLFINSIRVAVQIASVFRR